MSATESSASAEDARRTRDGRLDAALDRVGLRSPAARDAALAVVLALVTVGLLVPLTGAFAARADLRFSSAQRAALLVLSAAQALAVALRRTRPGVCLLLVCTLQVLLSVTVSSQATIRGAATIVAFYTAGTCLPLGRLLRRAGAAVVVELVGTPLVDTLVGPTLLARLGAEPATAHPTVAGWLLSGLSAVVLYGVAVAAGIAVGTRRENLALLRARAEAAERDRALDARRAVEAERLRMARELHDVAAHHLTGLLVQASAAEWLLGQDVAGARDALHEVRDQGKQALDNLRTVVGMLRHDGTGTRDELDPVPGLAVLPALVEQARGLGDQVQLDVVGAAYPLAPVADVTAYRVTQEALSNARQHAAGLPVRVRLGYGEHGVALTVRNPLPGPVPGPVRPGRHGGGFGLAGMHERAALVGAALRAGPVDGPAWEVALTLPRPDDD